MQRFKNILVVVKDDGPPSNNPAIARGAELAKRNNARLTLMDVVSPPQSTIAQYKGILKQEEITEMLVKEREDSLGRAAASLDTQIDVSVKVAVGKDFLEIVRHVVLGKHDIVIKVANQHPDSFDSCDFHIMRKCPEPVWLLKRDDHRKKQNILAAIDLGLESYDEGVALNKLIMDLATSLARWEESQLQVLSCWSLYGENALRHSSFVKVSETKLTALIEAEQKANKLRMDQFARGYNTQPIATHLIKGDPVDHVPKFVQDHGIDVVVMGTVARSGIPGLLIGNTAETILHMIDASVLTLKPRGFESPVH